MKKIWRPWEVLVTKKIEKQYFERTSYNPCILISYASLLWSIWSIVIYLYRNKTIYITHEFHPESFYE